MWRLRNGTALLAVCLMAMGCSSLLPQSRTATQTKWASYGDAQAAFDKIVPGQTTDGHLRGLQLDPDDNPNITLLNYTDILQRFVPNASISMDHLDAAVRKCIAAKTACTGYAVDQKAVSRSRAGNFFADILGFHRETHVTGWTFSGLLLMENGVVVYKLTAGQPKIAEQESLKNPLGPLTGFGRKVLGF